MGYFGRHRVRTGLLAGRGEVILHFGYKDGSGRQPAL